MGKYIELIATIALALFIIWLGGLSRTYHAFGGEEILALATVALGIRSFLKKREEERK